MNHISFRTYEGDRTGTGDYEKIHGFLVRTGRTDYTYARFDWMLTNWEYLEDEYLQRIGIWEKEGEIVGVTLFDHSLDVIFPIVLQGYEELYGEMIGYARDHMVKEKDPEFLIYSDDGDVFLKKELQRQGFIATEEKNMTAVYDLSGTVPERDLPEGYRITTLSEEEDHKKLLFCLFKGFGHEEAGETFCCDKNREEEMKIAYGKPHVDLALRVSVKDKDGNYAAHCGMWYDPKARLALVEPVCVIPEERRRGLGREAVYEGLRRVKALGAEIAVVGSSQQFYYALGFTPSLTGTVWKPGK